MPLFFSGIAVGIYATNSPEACRYVLEDSECNICVVENNAQLQKILQVREQLPYLKAIIQYTGSLTEKYSGVLAVSTHATHFQYAHPHVQQFQYTHRQRGQELTESEF